MRRLSPGQQEALRMRVVAAWREGMTGAQEQGVFGVSENSIRNWKARYAFGGVEGLESRRPGRRSGEARKLTPDQERALIEAIIEFEPEQLDLDGKLWTRRKATELARRLFGVSYTERGMGKLLRRMG